MNSKIFSRRSFSKSLCTSTLSPWLLQQFLLSKKLFAQQGQIAAKRIIFVISPTGIYPTNWALNSNPSEANLANHSQLSPLKSHFANLGFVYGLDNQCRAPNKHKQGPLTLLTSADAKSVGKSYTAGGISIDQLIANENFNPAVQRFKSINLSVAIPDDMKKANESRYSFAAPGEFVDPYYTPLSALNAIFGGG
ncbi:MAG: DUF1552 domain-containing protein [Oligoflexales bacterium]|nr:DUF1552 domain-containing protein [Oligoflexales bacterium]